MRKLSTYLLAGTLGLTGVTAVALVAPAVSSAATLDQRVSAVREALEGLVSDGSLTSAQADEVATVLAEQHRGERRGPGRHGGRPDLAAATEALGITADELRAAAEAGSSLAELAEQQGVRTDALVDALVTAKQSRLADAVADGRLTQAEADERSAEVQARITESLDEPIHLGHHGQGRHSGPDRSSETPSSAPEDGES